MPCSPTLHGRYSHPFCCYTRGSQDQEPTAPTDGAVMQRYNQGWTPGKGNVSKTVKQEEMGMFWGPMPHILWNMGPRLRVILPILLLILRLEDFCLPSVCSPAWIIHHFLLRGLQSLHVRVLSSHTHETHVTHTKQNTNNPSPPHITK